MKNVFVVADEQQLEAFQEFAHRYQKDLAAYRVFIKEKYKVQDLPVVLLWSDNWTAQHILRDCPLPAYTNDQRIVFNPEKSVWRDLYLKQFDGYNTSSLLDELKQSYDQLTNRHLLQILGHELLHHSEYFLDDWEEILWFEEGMVEYVSRRYFLTTQEFQMEKERNQKLVQHFEAQHASWPLSEFGQANPSGNYAAIFYDYWRSFLLIDQFVEDFGSVEAVFDHYHIWDREGRQVSLEDWFACDKN